MSYLEQCENTCYGCKNLAAQLKAVRAENESLKAENVSLRSGIKGDLLAKYKDSIQRHKEAAEFVEHYKSVCKEHRETIDQLTQSAEKALELIDASVCPCCDKSGGYYDSYGNVAQCQWCCEVEQLRAELDKVSK